MFYSMCHYISWVKLGIFLHLTTINSHSWREDEVNGFITLYLSRLHTLILISICLVL